MISLVTQNSPPYQSANTTAGIAQAHLRTGVKPAPTTPSPIWQKEIRCESDRKSESVNPPDRYPGFHRSHLPDDTFLQRLMYPEYISQSVLTIFQNGVRPACTRHARQFMTAIDRWRFSPGRLWRHTLQCLDIVINSASDMILTLCVIAVNHIRYYCVLPENFLSSA